MKNRLLALASIVALFSPTVALAAPLFLVTEIYNGLPGPDGTRDWFELTNFGDMAGSTGGLYMDDNSANPISAGALTALTLQPGESAIFLLEGVAADIPTFRTFWGPNTDSVQVGLVPGSNLALSGGGDAINLFASNASGSPVIESLGYGLNVAEQFSTITDPTGGLSFTNDTADLSVVDVHGAYLSAMSAGTANMPVAGSPGIAVPEPSSVLLALGACVGLTATIRRRRPI